jgi:hypothetical protein
MLYIVGLGLALSQIASVPTVVAATMVPSLIVGFFGVLIAFWISSDEANIRELKDYLGPAIKEKGDMLKRLMAEKKSLDQYGESTVVKDVDPPQPQKTE